MGEGFFADAKFLERFQRVTTTENGLRRFLGGNDFEQFASTGFKWAKFETTHRAIPNDYFGVLEDFCVTGDRFLSDIENFHVTQNVFDWKVSNLRAFDIVGTDYIYGEVDTRLFFLGFFKHSTCDLDLVFFIKTFADVVPLGHEESIGECSTDEDVFSSVAEVLKYADLGLHFGATSEDAESFDLFISQERGEIVDFFL